MNERLSKALLSGVSFVAISVPITSLIITAFAYFGILAQGILSYVLYIAFITIFFFTSLRTARGVGQKGWAVGFCVAAIIASLHLIYLFIGIETLPDFRFVMRSLILIVVCIIGGMVGVNTAKDIEPKSTKSLIRPNR